jgi:hypothetical protein
MRSDMARVIVERPRVKAFNNRRGRDVAWDDMPSHERYAPGPSVAWRQKAAQ